MSTNNEEIKTTTSRSGKPQYRKRGDKKGPRKQEDWSKCVDNAIEYYNKYPTDFDTAFNFPWFQVMGTPIDYTNITSGFSKTLGKVENASTPSIMRIKFVMGPGICENAYDPANRTFAMIMADLYAKTSGASLGFNNAQLAMQMTSLTSIINMIGIVQRALSCTEFYKTVNVNYPRSLLAAMGFDYDQVVANKAISVNRLNSLIHMFNNMQVPSFLDIYKRQYTLCSNVYVDEDDEFGQVYFFQPAGYYKYDFENFKAKWVDLTYGNTDVDIVLDAIRDALYSWVNNDDFYKVNGALLRAYKDVPTIIVPDSSVNDVITPAKPDHIIDQIQNMSIIKLDHNTLDIQQNVEKNLVYWQPCIPKEDGDLAPGTRGSMGKAIIRLFKDYPTNEDNCEATRLMAYTAEVAYHTVDISAGTDTVELRQGIYSMQSEVVDSVEIYKVSADYTDVSVLATIRSNYIPVYAPAQLTTWPTTSIESLKTIVAVQPFRYIPTLISRITMEGGVTTNMFMLGDLYNYTYIDRKVLYNMNTVALLSLWRPTV
nr:putative capsid protein [Chicken picobirnavirus]